MLIEYYPETMFGKLVLPPNDLTNGVKFSKEYGISKLSLFPRGVPFQLSNLPDTKVTPLYYKMDMDIDRWNELWYCAGAKAHEEGRRLFEELEENIMHNPFYKEDNVKGIFELQFIPNTSDPIQEHKDRNCYNSLVDKL